VTDDKLFYALTSRVNSRNTTILGVATIASTASFVLLGIVLNPDVEITIPIIFFGITFPSVVILWIELTYKGINRWDYAWITKIAQEEQNKKYDAGKILPYKKYRRTRGLLWRTFLIVPLIGWAFLFPDIIITILSLEIIIGYLIVTYRNEEIPSLEEIKFDYYLYNSKKSA